MPLTIVGHPLIWHRLAIIRDKQTPPSIFRQKLSEIAQLMLPSVLSDLNTTEGLVETPVGKATTKMLAETVVVIPILRAGLGMVEPFIQLVPDLKISYLDINRDPQTLMPGVRRAWLPETFDGACVVIIDPMLATGRTTSKAAQLVKEKNVGRVKAMCLLAAPEGVEFVTEQHPDLQLYAAAVDDGLNATGYIIPGLGDVGDRVTGFDLTYPAYTGKP